MMLPERRSSQRPELRLQAIYERSRGEPRTFPSVTMNVSRNGCTLKTGERVEAVGSVLTVHLIWDQDQACVEGKVIWTHAARLSPAGSLIGPATMGVRFSPDQSLPRGLLALLEEATRAGKGRARAGGQPRANRGSHGAVPCDLCVRPAAVEGTYRTVRHRLCAFCAERLSEEEALIKIVPLAQQAARGR
jgi:hypothetical protein